MPTDDFDSTPFMARFASSLQEVMTLNKPGDMIKWFEARGMPWEELKEIAQFAAEEVNAKPQAFCMGMMMGWLFHAETMLENSGEGENA